MAELGGMDEDVRKILSGKSEPISREYHVIVSHHSQSAHSSENINFGIRSDSVSYVKQRTEEIYPSSEYNIVQIKPIR